MHRIAHIALRVARRKFIRLMGALSLTVLTLLFLLNLIFPLPVDKLRPQSSTVIYDRNGKMMRAFLAPDEMWRMRVEFDDLSPILIDAVVSYEDKYFYRHAGINPVSVVRAAIANIRAGRFVQGASTITMQVARMMEPKERTIGGKLIEAFRAIQLELRFSKDEILTHYFNLAPYGGNIVGAGAASYAYFGKGPEQLSVGDAALLAAIPKSPNAIRPDMSHRNAVDARAKVLRLMAANGKITDAQLREALSESITDQRFPIPFEIPHLSTYLAQEYPHSQNVTTTIDAKIQHLAEEVLRVRMSPFRKIGIMNGAVVVIDNSTREVLALVGSYDFFESESDGQVNGAMAPRSPGSALKPFVYALGIDRGVITPMSLLYDVPVDYSGYSPENYDATHRGAVTVEDALTRSLNVPAVNLSAELGEIGVYSLLKEAGITTLDKPAGHYGLSLVLGGCEVTLLELTNIYAGLANGGLFEKYHLVISDKRSSARRFLSPEACYILSEMLSELRRPDLPAVWDWSIDMPKVAWKTGTSYGRRDAWSIGYTPNYTVGVWVGNFNGKGIPELVGAEAAAPVLFGIVSALEKGSQNRWFVQPDGVGTRQVCSVSGMPLAKHCSSARDELFIPGVSPYAKCSIHKPIYVDRKTGYRMCRHCRGERECEERIVEQWPAEVATWMQRNGYHIDEIPEHNPKCPGIMAGRAPIINSPTVDTEYKLRYGVALEYQKILLDASVSNRTKTIYWFLDNELVYSGDPSEKVFISPHPGKHTVVCSDDEGRSSEVMFVVRQ